MCMGVFGTNTYFLENEKEVIVVDPAGKASKIREILGDKKLLAILLTHGHFDHIKAVDELYSIHKVPVYINKKDEGLCRDKNQCLTFGLPYSPAISCPLVYLNEGTLKISSFEFEVIFTPGHTKGSTCFKIENYLLTGDTLFKNSVGRTDLEGGDNRELKSSLRIIKELDPELIVLPGHEQTSTLNEELENNQFLV